MSICIGRDDLAVAELASLVVRGQRSAIGAYGFAQGGLLVEGGKYDPTQLSPLIFQQPFCPDWRIVLFSPKHLQGLSGQREQLAIDHQLHISQRDTQAMCSLVLLGLLPALVERDIDGFGQALYDLQQCVGSCFANVQGGIYANPLLEQIVSYCKQLGVKGLGQSSWGPTLYAVVEDENITNYVAKKACKHFELKDDEVWVTEADHDGARVSVSTATTGLASAANSL